jgi:hypothetical protein
LGAALGHSILYQSRNSIVPPPKSLFPFASQIVKKQIDNTLRNSKLTIKFVKGDIQRGVDFIGDMRPFITIIYKDKVIESKPAMYSGYNPEWNDMIDLRVDSLSD